MKRFIPVFHLRTDVADSCVGSTDVTVRRQYGFFVCLSQNWRRQYGRMTDAEAVCFRFDCLGGVVEVLTNKEDRPIREDSHRSLQNSSQSILSVTLRQSTLSVAEWRTTLSVLATPPPHYLRRLRTVSTKKCKHAFTFEIRLRMPA